MGELYTEIHGDPACPTLILLHGGGAASRTWKHQFSGLADRFHMVAPDLPGFGRSPGPVSIETSVAAVSQLVRRYSPVHLCGFSLGAFVAAQLAAEEPEHVSRVILCGANLKPADSEPRQIRFFKSRRGWWLMKALSDLPDRPALLEMVDEVEQADLTGALPRIQAPTLVLCGRRDSACRSDVSPISELLPHATSVVVPYAGHSLPISRPGVFNTIVRGFLASAD